MYVPGLTISRLLALLVLPLLLPTLLVNVLKIEKSWVKYAVLTCSVIASGLSYAAFTFQLMLILIFPTVVAALYYNKRVMLIICAESVVNIFLAHVLSHYIMFAQILEPFKGIRNIIQFAALPRIAIYLCFAAVFIILSNRTSSLMLNVYRVTQENKLLELQNTMTDKVARYEEREKISCDIHNSVGHAITAAIMALDASEAVRTVSPNKADAKVSDAGKRMRESLQLIRESVRLVDSSDTSVILRDLVKALTICIRQFELDTNTIIVSNLSSVPDEFADMNISADHARFLYGAIQECLTNSVKHGSAHNITMKFRVNNNSIETEIIDDGAGVMLNEVGTNKGFGLRKIEYYLKANGGSLLCCGDSGFSVSMCLPIEEML